MLLESYASKMDELVVEDLDVRMATSSLELINVSRSRPLSVLTFRRTGKTPQLSLEVPLSDADGFWYPGATGQRFLPPDWTGENQVSMISSSPIGALYDASGETILGFAYDAQITESTIRFGVSEEWKEFVVHIELSEATPEVIKLALINNGPRFTSTIATLKSWLADHLAQPPMPRSNVSTVPAYSTWYSYSQDISAEKIEKDAKIARAIGCRVVFIDDGWQLFGDGRWYQGCGDWQPDPRKFPDFGQHISHIHKLDLAVVLWLAPLLLGKQAKVFQELERFAPSYSERLRGYILDP